MEKKYLHLNYLQLFADDFGDPEVNPEGNPNTGDADGKPEGKPEGKYTDDDVNKIINRKFAEWEKKHKSEVDEAKKLAEMNAQEKAEYDAKKLKAELDELKEKNTLAEMTKTARKMLSEAKINVSDEVISVLVTTDAEKTKEAVEGFAELFKSAVQDAVKDALKGNTPKTGTEIGLTKEEIMKVSDRKERQKLIAENKELFTGGN